MKLHTSMPDIIHTAVKRCLLRFVETEMLLFLILYSLSDLNLFTQGIFLYFLSLLICTSLSSH
jgi:hypothetical protein